jgi:accessory secretory protein Asp2
MVSAIKVLQIGKKSRTESYDLKGIDWVFFKKDEITLDEEDVFDVVFLDEAVDRDTLKTLDPFIQTYHLFIHEDIKDYYLQNDNFIKRKLPKFYLEDEFLDLSKRLPFDYYRGQEGYSANLNEIHISYNGKQRIEGKSDMVLSGDFDGEVIALKRGFNLKSDQRVEVWIEYEKSKEITLSVVAYEILEGSLDRIVKTWHYDEEDLQQALVFAAPQSGSVNLSLIAKGSGKLTIGNIHIRRSRGKAGAFLVGGEVHYDASRREFISYFEPGNLKPPLNVYFSGYRTAEGFEGYFMMKKMKHPFLLLGDPRLEGGSFYIGSKEYEHLIIKVIKETLKKCGFDSRSLILSGLSMGSFGALYYGAQLDPHAIIVGKPIVNLGSMAENETLFRPNGFPTSFDVLKENSHGISDADCEELNQKFWTVFKKANFSNTKLAISYMRQDDYDGKAFKMLVDATHDQDVFIYGKGIEGRHNDNTSAIVSWFVSQYKYILKKDFEEGEMDE